MTFRFLHTSDLHLGKPFGGFGDDIAHRLREARHGAIARLAAAARGSGAGVILLAGDTFDAETPSPSTLRQALRAMAAEADMIWLLLPGNHDSLAATELWRQVRADGGSNLRVLDDPRPIALPGGAVILPAPCTQRRPGRDLTEWMTGAATPEGALRIGLAHGAVTDFTEGRAALGIIPPDRAARSRLDYLALGDWHGIQAIGPRTWYSGTPETDAFTTVRGGQALLVTLDGPGAPSRVDPVPTGALDWQILTLDLLPGDGDPLAALLPPPARRRETLLRLLARGRLGLPERAALEAGIAAVGPDFGWLEADLSALAAEVRTDDLDLVDRAGALRQAAEALLAESRDAALSEADRAIADAALMRLFALSQEEGA